MHEAVNRSAFGAAGSIGSQQRAVWCEEHSEKGAELSLLADAWCCCSACEAFSAKSCGRDHVCKAAVGCDMSKDYAIQLPMVY